MDEQLMRAPQGRDLLYWITGVKDRHQPKRLFHHVARGLARAVGAAEAGSSGHGWRG